MTRTTDTYLIAFAFGEEVCCITFAAINSCEDAGGAIMHHDITAEISDEVIRSFIALWWLK